MGVKKRWSEKHKRDMWGYDVRFGTGARRTRRRRFGFSSKEAAEIALSKLRVRENERRAGVLVEPPSAPTVTVKALVERRAAQLQDTYRHRITAGVIGRWAATLSPGILVTELKTSHLSAYADERRKTVKPQTVFRELTDVCSMLARARPLPLARRLAAAAQAPHESPDGRARARDYGRRGRGHPARAAPPARGGRDRSLLPPAARLG